MIKEVKSSLTTLKIPDINDQEPDTSDEEELSNSDSDEDSSAVSDIDADTSDVESDTQDTPAFTDPRGNPDRVHESTQVEAGTPRIVHTLIESSGLERVKWNHEERRFLEKFLGPPNNHHLATEDKKTNKSTLRPATYPMLNPEDVPVASSSMHAEEKTRLEDLSLVTIQQIQRKGFLFLKTLYLRS